MAARPILRGTSVDKNIQLIGLSDGKILIINLQSIY